MNVEHTSHVGGPGLATRPRQSRWGTPPSPRSWLPAALAAMALLLGACVAETSEGDEQPVAQSVNAEGFLPVMPKDPGGRTSGASFGPSNPSAPRTTTLADPRDPVPDPEPSPWDQGNSPQNH